MSIITVFEWVTIRTYAARCRRRPAHLRRSPQHTPDIRRARRRPGARSAAAPAGMAPDRVGGVGPDDSGVSLPAGPRSRCTRPSPSPARAAPTARVLGRSWNRAVGRRAGCCAAIKTPASRQSRRPVRIGTDSVGKTITAAKIVSDGNDLVLDPLVVIRPQPSRRLPDRHGHLRDCLLEIPQPRGRLGGQSVPPGNACPGPNRPRQERLHPAAARLSSESLKRGRRHHLSQQAHLSHIGIRCEWSRCPAIAVSALPADTGGNTRVRTGASHP